MTHGETSASGWSHSDCYAEPADCVSTPKGVQDLYAGTAVNDGVPGGQPYNFNEIALSAAPGNTQSDAESCLPAGATDKDDVGATCANWLKFCRGLYDDTDNGVDDLAAHVGTCSNVDRGGTHASTGGSSVLAWGQLNDTSGAGGAPLCFLADLEFIPDPPEVKGGALKFTSATLMGVRAPIWHPPAGAADCESGQKNKI